MSTSDLTDTTVSPSGAVAPSGDRSYGIPYPGRLLTWNSRLTGIVTGTMLLVAAVVAGIFFNIPRVEISPANNATAVRSGGIIRIEVPRFSSISKVSVAVNGEQQWLEYNIEDSTYSPPIQPASGSMVTVDVKTTSAIGIVREFSSSFTTVEPLAVTSARAGGREISPNSAISPQTPMSFSFDKPVAAAWISIDGAASMPLTLGADGLSGNLEPSFVLKQGAEHTLAVIASGADGSGIAAGEKKTFNVIKPLLLTADASALSTTGSSQVFLKSSVPFDDPDLVGKSIRVSNPEKCDFSVQPTGILLNIHDLGDSEISVSVSSAFGNDGSYLELPAEFHFRGTTDAYATTGTGTFAVSATYGSTISKKNNPASGADSGAAESDIPPPPPGWPPCCPWPPR
ncbi:MAG: hypothetical protein WC911_09980 [Thermoleophilia bacterium]